MYVNFSTKKLWLEKFYRPSMRHLKSSCSVNNWQISRTTISLSSENTEPWGMFARLGFYLLISARVEMYPLRHIWITQSSSCSVSEKYLACSRDLVCWITVARFSLLKHAEACWWDCIPGTTSLEGDWKCHSTLSRLIPSDLLWSVYCILRIRVVFVPGFWDRASNPWNFLNGRRRLSFKVGSWDHTWVC